MQRIQLGKTDLFVMPIGFGANAIGTNQIYANADIKGSKQLLLDAIDKGVNFFDTAYSYGNGLSEQVIGEALKERGNRDDIVVASKVSIRDKDGVRVHDNSPDFLTSEVEKSLQRLQMDYVDVMYIHFPDETTPKDEAIGALQRLKEQGKIRAIGVSNFSPDQLVEANKDGYVDVYQGGYNLINRSAEDWYFPYVLQHDIAFIPYFPLASGLLTGKHTKESTFTDFRAKLPHFGREQFTRNLEKVDRLKPIAVRHEVDVANIVLAWYLQQQAVTAVIPGAKNSTQLNANCKTLDVRLSEQEVQEIAGIFPKESS